MLNTHHGLGTAFTSYADCFNDDIDEDALTYPTLANKLIHTVRHDAITIAEDISGMPGLALPVSEGGCGFDYRFALGVPDYWINLLKQTHYIAVRINSPIFAIASEASGRKGANP